MAAPMKNKTVRLSKEQIKGLQAEAKKLSAKSPVPVQWSALIRVAIDEFLGGRAKTTAAAR
jgi:hypothetical protein